MDAYSYIRWSSNPQTDGDSLARQLNTTRTICKQKGWTLDETLKPDAAVSGYTGDNLTKGSLAGFLMAVEQHRIKTPCVLVVEALDRLTRTRLRDARKLFDGLLEKGVQICTANNGKVYDDASLDNPIDLFMSLMELNAAHLYSKTISERVRAAWTRKKEAAAKGVILTTKTPGWIKADRATNKLTLIPEKAAVVKRIYTSYLAGKGARLIMRELNRDNIPSFGHGGAWNTTHVDRLLRSPTVIGQYQPRKHTKNNHQLDGLPVEGYYPAAIEKELFYKVQDAVKTRSCPVGKKVAVHSLFTGIASCSKCGHHLTYMAMSKHSNRKRYDWLRCDSSARATGCKAKNISYPQVERGILSILAIYIVLQMNSRSVDNTELTGLEAELTHTQERLTKLKELIEDPHNISKTVLQAIRELETKEEALKGKIAIAPPPTGAVNPFTTWKPLAKTPDNRIALRMILNRTIESFILDTTDKTATLTLKGVTAKINLKWVGQPQQRGTDGQLLERPLDKFYINGKEQPYLDNVVIWQSPENFKDSKLLTLVLMGCVINHIAMKAPHSLPAPPKP